MHYAKQFNVGSFTEDSILVIIMGYLQGMSSRLAAL